MISLSPLMLFDLDGTLVDSAPDLVAALNHTLALEGVPALTEARVRPLLGAGARALIERGFTVVGRDLPSNRMDTLFDAFLEYYHAHIADHSRPYPGVEAALDRLEAAGWRLAVATNKLEGLSVSLLTQLGLAGRFAAICGQDTFRDEAGRNIAKPDRRMLLKTIAKVGGTPGQAVMVGDSRPDIEAARNSGLLVIGVTFGYADAPIETFSPDATISHFDQLWDATLRLRPAA